MRTSLAKFISTEGLVHCLMEASFLHPPIHVGCNGQLRTIFIKRTYRAVPFSSPSNPQGSFARIILEVLGACITVSVTLSWLDNWCPINTKELTLVTAVPKKFSKMRAKFYVEENVKVNMVLAVSKCTFAMKRTYTIHDINITIRLESPHMKG